MLPISLLGQAFHGFYIIYQQTCIIITRDYFDFIISSKCPKYVRAQVISYVKNFFMCFLAQLSMPIYM